MELAEGSASVSDVGKVTLCVCIGSGLGDDGLCKILFICRPSENPVL